MPSERPVAGLMLSNVAPFADETKRPSMNTCERGFSAAARSRHWAAEIPGLGGHGDP